MKVKTPKLVNFIEGLHRFMAGYPEFRGEGELKPEAELRGDMESLILGYLENYFERSGYKNAAERALDTFCRSARVAEYAGGHSPVFGEKTYPDFILLEPYRVAIEYRQVTSGAMVKTGIGQSMTYTFSGEYDLVYVLFHDISPGRRVERSVAYKLESSILAEMWDRYNVFLRFV